MCQREGEEERRREEKKKKKKKKRRRRIGVFGRSRVSVYVWMFRHWTPGEGGREEKRGACLDQIPCHVTACGP